MVTVTSIGAGDQLLYLGELCNSIDERINGNCPGIELLYHKNFIILARRGYAKFRGSLGVSRPSLLTPVAQVSHISYLHA